MELVLSGLRGSQQNLWSLPSLAVRALGKQANKPLWHICLSGANWVLSDIELGPRICVDQRCQICLTHKRIALLFQQCLCWKTTIRNQLRGVFCHTQIMFSYQTCFVQPNQLQGVFFHTNMFCYQTCFFQPIRSFVPTVSLLENDNSQPVAGCIFPHKHVFLPNMFFQSIHSFGPTVSLLENDNSHPVAGCIFPHNDVFSQVCLFIWKPKKSQPMMICPLTTPT